jgi:hypothetical protein
MGGGGETSATARSPPLVCRSVTCVVYNRGAGRWMGGCEWSWGGQSGKLGFFRGGHSGRFGY